MKNKFFLCLLILASTTSLAQKKMIPVTQSALIGITLPAGSMQDKRILSVSAANSLLDMESKKTGRIVSTTEVLVIPSADSGGFDQSMLSKELVKNGWKVSVNEADKKYAWLQKGNQSIIMYFSASAKESSLYFALDVSSPQNTQVNDTSVNTGIKQDQQTINSSAQYKPVEFYDQKETIDIITYSPPKDWEKEVTENIVIYSIANNLDKTWCQIGIAKSTNSKGSIELDFKSEWSQLVATPYNIADLPHTSEVSGADGWMIQSGSGQFTFNNTKAAAILTTFSGYGRCVSIIATTGNQRHLNDIESFLSHIDLKIPDTNQKVQKEIIAQTSQQTSGNGFAFSTTNFDDGWVATAEDDWVQVTKGSTVVLIHYPNKQADAYNSVLMDGLKNAWDILIAPKYSSATNMEFKSSGSWESIEFAEADMVEKITGKTVYVVFFKKNFSNGSGKYIEFISPNKKTFEQEFGTYENASANFGTGPGWDKMANMASYNKFAVAASDLQGKWTSDFSGAIQYVNAYTGFDAGMDTHASNENFLFGPGNTYQWDLGVASGQVGNIKFQSVKSTGNFSMNGNWQINFSEIEGKPRTYDAYFSCIKDLRVLCIDNKGYFKVQ